MDLKVNLDKSNVVVFHKGGFLGARESWSYQGIVMPVVNVYKYLGILFSTTKLFCSMSRLGKEKQESPYKFYAKT